MSALGAATIVMIVLGLQGAASGQSGAPATHGAYPSRPIRGRGIPAWRRFGRGRTARREPDVARDFAAISQVAKGALVVVVSAAISSFLAEQGIRDINGVPMLDCQAVAIKTAEMQVDLRRMGMPKPGEGGESRVVKKDIETARRTYGVTP